MKPRTRACALALILVVVPAAAGAQPPQLPPSLGKPVATDDAMLVAQGWLLLAQGSPVPAVERARQVLAKSPWSPGAVTLAVEAEIVRGGSAAGLAEYERWLGARKSEEPLLLHRVSQALLREAAAQTADEGARIAALRALAADGDGTAARTLQQAMTGGDRGAAMALAESGDADAVHFLIEATKSGALDAVRGLQAVSKARNAEAISFALARLDDPRTEIRLAAIGALARMRVREAAPRLRPLLSDDRPFIRVAAAEALLAAGDDSGVPLLRDLAGSDSPEDRLRAAEAMKDQRDAAWIAMVRQLTTASEPEVRLGAARLIAPIDPDLAASVVETLRQDANPVIRSMTNDAVLRTMPSDLGRLRTLLHAATLGERVIGAERVLAATR